MGAIYDRKIQSTKNIIKEIENATYFGCTVAQTPSSTSTTTTSTEETVSCYLCRYSSYTYNTMKPVLCYIDTINFSKYVSISPKVSLYGEESKTINISDTCTVTFKLGLENGTNKWKIYATFKPTSGQVTCGPSFNCTYCVWLNDAT